MNKASVEMTNFSATQILRENNYLYAFYYCKNGILGIFVVLNFDFSKFGPKLKSRVPKTKTWQIDFT